MSRKKDKKLTLDLLLVTETKDTSKQLNIVELEMLLKQKTLKAHYEAFKLLQQNGLAAFQRWEEIHSHPKKRHLFSMSTPELVNDFAHMILVHLNSESRVLELGCGYGNDALFIATKARSDILAVDASQTAIVDARKRAKSETLTVDFISQDYVQTLSDMKGAGLDMVYSYSTAHYWPGRLFEDILLPSIADVLNEKGVFCLSIQVANSASAQKDHQIHINSIEDDNPYLYLIDKDDYLFKMYPKTKDVLVKALAPYFDILYEEEVEVEGYNMVGKVDIFVSIIARPKRGGEGVKS